VAWVGSAADETPVEALSTWFGLTIRPPCWERRPLRCFASSRLTVENADRRQVAPEAPDTAILIEQRAKIGVQSRW